MRSWLWPAVRPGVMGSALAVILFALYLGLRGDVRPSAPALTHLLVVGALAGTLTQGAAWLTRYSHRRLLRQLEERIVALRENPSPHALRGDGGVPPPPELLPVLDQLEVLAGCYRKALAEVVQAQEALEQARPAHGRGDPDAHDQPYAPVPTHYVVGSSRHRMVARLTPNLHWMAATPPLQQFLGANVQDLIARSFLDVVHPDDAPGLTRALEDALKDGEGHNINFRILVPRPAQGAEGGASPPPTTPAPGERHLQMDVMTCYTERGVPLHLRCHFLDVTDRILTERELRVRTEDLSDANARLRQINADLQRLKESYRDLYHQAPVLYFSLDAGGRFVAFNETMVRTLGYPREALLGQPYTLLLPPGSRDAFLHDASAFQRPGELETQWLKADGTVIDVWIGTTTIKDPLGRFVRSRSAARDVTERNRLANALRATAEEVGRANAELRRINQELKDFTYVVSHDLKEPLRTLEAFSNFLAQDCGPALGSEGREYITHLVQASRRLGALIDDLLALSRAGRVIHTPSPFSWDEVIQTVRQDLRDLLQRRQAVLRVEGLLPAVAGDRARVIQLLTNLASNGLRYNKSARPEVVLGASAGDPNGNPQSGFVTFHVRDNGIGIAPAYHEQIFRMFKRLHRRDEIDGTGAGLAICKKIVEAHGGRIWVESAEGQGATFYFTLPQVRPAPGRTVIADSQQITADHDFATAAPGG